MKDFKDVSKLVIIYLPNGKEAKYCTKDLGGNEYTLAKTIECDPAEVKIALKEDKNVVVHGYVGMPYHLQMF